MDHTPSLRVPETILVVDDAANVRRLVCRMVASSGFTVVEARDADEALKAAAAYSGTIDLIISDLFLGSTSGLELAAKLTYLRPGLAVLLMSGSSERLLEKTGWHFIQKPFSTDELYSKIQQILQISQETPAAPNGRDETSAVR
jgi:DNA-binding NtrC family response regulator